MNHEVQRASLLDLLDAFETNWGDHCAWDAMRLDLLLIVAAAKREEAVERGHRMMEVIYDLTQGELLCK